MQEPILSPDACAVRREARASYLRVGLGLFLFSLLPTALALLLSFIFHRFAPQVLNVPYFSWIMQVLLMYGIAFPLAYLVIGRSPLAKSEPKTGGKFPFLLFFTVFWLLSGVARIGALISELMMLVVEHLTGMDQSNPVTDMLSDTPLWIVFVVVVVLGPIVEELLFRRAVMERLLPFGEKSAILFSAVAFGIMHGNFYQLFYTVGMGLLIAYLYARTRDVRLPILLHMIYNFMGSIIPLSFMPLLEELTAGEPAPAWLLQNLLPIFGMLAYTLLQLALPVVGIVLLAVFCKRIHFDPCSHPLRASEHARACFLNAGTILFVIFTCFELVFSLFF